MSEPELTFQSLSRRLRVDALPVAEPSEDLWLRIAQRRRDAARHARRRRFAALGGGFAALAVLAAGVLLHAPQNGGEVDWQARAQALELRVRELEHERTAAVVAPEAQSELVRLDAKLQRAYDDGADRVELDDLWRRRSELLAALLRAHRENVHISRI